MIIFFKLPKCTFSLHQFRVKGLGFGVWGLGFRVWGFQDDVQVENNCE